MSERKLRNRRKRFSKGRAIRVSDLVFDTIDKARKSGGHRTSWDCFMRRMLGLPNRAGVTQPLVEGMLEATTGIFVLKLGETSWAELEETAYKLADRIARTKKITMQQPLRMREMR